MTPVPATQNNFINSGFKKYNGYVGGGGNKNVRPPKYISMTKKPSNLNSKRSQKRYRYLKMENHSYGKTRVLASW